MSRIEESRCSARKRETLQNEIEQLMLDEQMQGVQRQTEQKERAFTLLRQVLEALQKER